MKVIEGCFIWQSMPSKFAIFAAYTFVLLRGFLLMVAASESPPQFTLSSRAAAAFPGTGVNDPAPVARQNVPITHEYYDFILQEYSFKFWQYFTLFGLGLIAYAGVASTYFSRSNYVVPPPEYEYDYFGKRRRRRSVRSVYPSWKYLDVRTINMILKVIDGLPSSSDER